MIIALIAVLGIASVTASLWVPYDPLVAVGLPLMGPSRSHWFWHRRARPRHLRASGVRASTLHSRRGRCRLDRRTCWHRLRGLLRLSRRMASNSFLMRVTDFALALPSIVVAAIIVVILGPGTITPALAGVVVTLPLFARVARGSTLAEREKPYVLATRALGARQTRIIFRTLLPAIVPVIVIQAAIAAAFAILLEASLKLPRARGPAADAVVRGDGSGCSGVRIHGRDVCDLPWRDARDHRRSVHRARQRA